MLYLELKPIFFLQAYKFFIETPFRCYYSALEPSSLAKAIYPVLVSYSSPDKQAFPRHTLSRAALIMSESPIFLLDAFTNLIVYYSPSADPSLPFPPPHDCKYTISLFAWCALFFSLDCFIYLFVSYLCISRRSFENHD